MKSILIIEDNQDVRENTAEILELAGYRVLQAENGRAGVETAQKSKPDLIICDIMMPQMDGVETFQRIKDQLQEDGIPIFITTALNRKPWFADLEAEGAVIIQKPFDIDQLLRLVNDMLS